MRERAILIVLLILMGAGWGVTLPLTKIAVGAGYRQFGLIFWQFVISSLILGAILAARRRRLPLGRAQLRMYLVIALLGSVLPSSAFYYAATLLPAGILAIGLSTVPMFAFPMALLMATDRFSWLRFSGLMFGLAGVLVLIAPEATLPERAMVAFIPLALVAPVFYALEVNIVAKFGTAALNPIQLLCGASVLGALIALPLALGSGQWIDPAPPWGAPDQALIALAVIGAVVYSGYVWMVGRAGAVFAAQVSYLVTGFGVVWSMLVLGERYSGWVWLALALMFVGLFLVQPRPRAVLVMAGKAGQDGGREKPTGGP